MKTIVGSFDSFDEAKRVAQQLMDDGFRDADVNVIANNASGQYGGGMSGAAIEGVRSRTGDGDALTTDGGGLTAAQRGRTRDDVVDDASGAATGAVTGGVVGGAAGLAASLIGLAIPGIGPIIAAGPIVAALSGAGVGAVAGGLIGGLTDMGVSKEDAEYYAESVRRGDPDDPQTGKPLDATRPAGEWNQVTLLISPEKCVHEINGTKYFEYVLGSEDFENRVADSKFGRMRRFAKTHKGSIALQGDHGEVSFRNIKIRPIAPTVGGRSG